MNFKLLLSLGFVVGAASLLTGCNHNPATKSSGFLEQFAQSYLLARAVDGAQVASKQGNTRALARASFKLRDIDINSLQNWVEQTQLDPMMLNTLGYSLADDGVERADWERAELLTRLSYQKWGPTDGNEGVTTSQEITRYLKATLPGDSWAWALFKLKRVEEARDKEEEVFHIMGTSKVARVFGSNPEILFHLAEIYRVSGEANKSRALCIEALNENPDGALRDKINVSLKLMSGEWREVQRPVSPTRNAL